MNTTRDNIDDACAFAWMQLFRKQPERDTAFNWLWKVAWHEALRLDRLQRRVDDITDAQERLTGGVDPASSVELRLDASEKLELLGEREREAFLLRGAGYTYAEAARRLGISSTRLHAIIARGAMRLRRREDEMHPEPDGRTPRARLLQELLREPPAFLMSTIGRPPTGQTRTRSGERRLEWVRLALAIVDYRTEHGVSDPARAFGDGRVPAAKRAELERDIAMYEAGRPINRYRGIEQ